MSWDILHNSVLWMKRWNLNVKFVGCTNEWQTSFLQVVCEGNPLSFMLVVIKMVCPTAFDSLIINSKLNPAHTILLPHTKPSSQDKCFTTWTSIKLQDIFWLNIWIVYEDKTRYFLPKTSQSLLTLTKCFLCLNLTRPKHSVVATWHWKLNLRKCKNWQISSCLQKHKHI